VPLAPRPDLASIGWTTFDDKPATFIKWLELAGGKGIRVADRAELAARLDQWPVYTTAAKRLSLVNGIGQSNVDWDAISDPHRLEDIDFALLPAQFGVAESGAVWMTDEHLKHRTLPFIVQHLGIVIATDSIVDTMNHAYRQVKFSGRGFGMFLAGPSKTADIEQSLVIGAHGPRSHVVFLVDSGFTA
jgi:L-lactate dehydrogenase complex protein LldG